MLKTELTREQAMDAITHVLCGEGSFMGCEAENVTASASLRDDLGLDSLDFVEFAINLEEKLGLEEIDESDISEAAAVGDVAKMLARKKVIAPDTLKRTMAEIEKGKGELETLAKKGAAEAKKRIAEKQEKDDATKALAMGPAAKAKAAGAGA